MRTSLTPLTALPILLALLLSSVGGEVQAQSKEDAPPAKRSGMVRSLIIAQSANGLPNQPTTEKVLQKLVVSENRLRLDDLQGGVIYLLELVDGEPQLKEVSKDLKRYRESDELGELQRSRNQAERQILARLKSAPELERKSVMAKLHLRPNLEREVEVVRTGEKKKILERDTERVLVKENGRTIVDVWLASSEKIDIPFFHFYSKLGAFSDEVLPKLAELEGLPLEVTFNVVTATLTYKISVNATDLVISEVPLSEFQVPATAELVKRETMSPCPICGTLVEIASPPAGQSKRRDGSRVYFDSRECKIEFNRKTYPERFPTPR